jgi:Icc-related predicted phosphoesterase
MRILVVSDLHGALDAARAALDHFEPDVFLCCGDWGDPEQVTEADLAAFPARLPVLTTFGNHDPLDILPKLRNPDGSPVLLGQGEVRALDGLRVAAIGGIWAKSHKRPYYVTDDDVDEAAARIAANGPVDILLTHACPVGVADLTPKGRHGGQRCFLKAFQTIEPKVQVCGHLHRAQEHTLKDGRQVFNVGATPAGTVVLIETSAKGLSARLERFSPGGPPSA